MVVEWISTKEPISYPYALEWMQQRVEEIYTGKQSEVVWLLEHPPIYTAGTSALAEELLAHSLLPVYPSNRGGRYTYHGPGQRVIYAMLNLAFHQKDIRWYIAQLEEWILQTLADFHIFACRRPGRIGLWVTSHQGAEAKIAAIGVRMRRWVTLHGIALNVYPDLTHFQGIIPCGIQEYGVTSLWKEGVCVGLEEVDQALHTNFQRIFKTDTQLYKLDRNFINAYK